MVVSGGGGLVEVDDVDNVSRSSSHTHCTSNLDIEVWRPYRNWSLDKGPQALRHTILVEEERGSDMNYCATKIKVTSSRIVQSGKGKK